VTERRELRPSLGIQRIVSKRMKEMELRAFLCVGCLLGVENKGTVWVGRPPSPGFSVTADSKGVRSVFFESADSKEFREKDMARKRLRG
jgi:hypothetical protein